MNQSLPRVVAALLFVVVAGVHFVLAVDVDGVAGGYRTCRTRKVLNAAYKSKKYFK
jgi:hypothetical protein